MKTPADTVVLLVEGDFQTLLKIEIQNRKNIFLVY